MIEVAFRRIDPDQGSRRRRRARAAARGLFNTLVYAKAEDDLARRDALLDELRALARAHPDDAAVRQPLASIIASLGWKISPAESVSTGADRPRVEVVLMVSAIWCRYRRRKLEITSLVCSVIAARAVDRALRVSAA